MTLYPVLLNLDGARCVIVGGGRVARRKVEHLLGAGARVCVVAPRFDAALRRLAARGKIDLVRSAWKGEFLRPDDRLVFACTDDPEVNRGVAVEARRLNVPVNCTDDAEGGDFHIPSMVRRDDLLLTVSTGGAAPALAREICHRLEQQFGPAWGDFARLLGDFRRRWKRRGESERIHARMREIIGSDVFEIMQSRGAEAAGRKIRRIVRRLEAERAANKGTNKDQSRAKGKRK